MNALITRKKRTAGLYNWWRKSIKFPIVFMLFVVCSFVDFQLWILDWSWATSICPMVGYSLLMSAALICGISARMGGHQPTTLSLSKQVTASSFETSLSFKLIKKEREREKKERGAVSEIKEKILSCWELIKYDKSSFSFLYRNLSIMIFFW